MGVTVADLVVKARGDTKHAEDSVNRLNTGVQKSPGFFKTAAASAVGFGTAMVGMAVAGKGFDFIGSAAIGMNAELETSTLQFQTLMGDADRAGEHVKSLFDFAAKTPFETGPIITASKHLQVFGGDALNTQDNLTLVGDAAAAMGVGMDEVAFWTGRAYNAIQAGKPFGESAMRLQEMGILTAEARAEMEEMQAAGASTSEVWAVMNDDLGRNAGAMELQAGTWTGLMATFVDGAQMALADAFQPLFQGAKGALEGLIGIMDSGVVQNAMSGMVSGVADGASLLIGGISTAIETFRRDGIGGPVTMVMTAGSGIATAIAGWAAQIVPQLATLGAEFVNWLLGALPGLVTGMNEIRTTIVTAILAAVPVIATTIAGWATSFLGWITTMLPQLGTALGGVATAMLSWITGVVPIIAESVKGWVPALIGWITTDAVPGLLAALGGLVDGFVAFIGDGANITKLTTSLVQWSGAFVGWVATTLIPQVIGALPGLIADIAGFIVTNTPKLVEALLTMGASMIAGLVAGIMPALGTLLGNIGGWFGGLISSAGTWAASVVATIVSWIAGLPGKVMSWFGTLLYNVSTWFGGLSTSAGTWTSTVVATVIRFFATLPSKAITAIGGLVSLLSGWFRRLPGEIWDRITGAGEAIARGIWSGIQNLAGWLWDKVSGWVSGIIDSVLGFFGIHSPSTVFAGIGADLVAGLARGISRNSDLAEDAMRGSLRRVSAIGGAAVLSPALSLSSSLSAPSMGGLGVRGRMVAPALVGGGPVYNVTLNADRYVGTREEALMYVAEIDREIRSLQSG